MLLIQSIKANIRQQQKFNNPHNNTSIQHGLKGHCNSGNVFPPGHHSPYPKEGRSFPLKSTRKTNKHTNNQITTALIKPRRVKSGTI